jgi:hypothetical protein
MATETERRLRAQLRAKSKPGPMQQRLQKMVQTGLVPYGAAVGLGYASEHWGEEKGAMAIIGATAGGLGLQAILNPKQGSAVDVLLSGIAAAGASSYGLEHGRMVSRIHTAKKMMQESDNIESDRSLDSDTRNGVVIDSEQQRVMNNG